MNSITLGFRDYLVHFLPGVISLYTLYVAYPPIFSAVLAYDPVLIVPMLLLAGYIAGFFLDTLVFIRPYRHFGLILKDPLKKKFNSNPTLAKELINKHSLLILEAKYGVAFVEKQSFSQQMYFMMRSINAESEYLSTFISRINSLENLARNSVLPIFILSCVLAYNSNYVVAAIAFLLSIALIYKRSRYRVWLARTVMRSYIALFGAVVPKD